MPQPIPTSPLDSHTPSDEVRFDLHKGGEYLAPYEHITEEREVAEALQRALAAASGGRISEEAVQTIDTVQAAETQAFEVPRVSIEQLYNASRTIVWARQEEIDAA